MWPTGPSSLDPHSHILENLVTQMVSQFVPLHIGLLLSEVVEDLACISVNVEH